MLPGNGVGRVFPKLGLSPTGRVEVPGRGAGRVSDGLPSVGPVSDGFVAGGRTVGRVLPEIPGRGTFAGPAGFGAGRLIPGSVPAPPRDGREPPREGLVGRDGDVGREGTGRCIEGNCPAFPSDGFCPLGRVTFGTLGRVLGRDTLG